MILWTDSECRYKNINVDLTSLCADKLNFRRPKCRKLLSGRFIKAVHLVHPPIIAEQSDLQLPLTVLAAPGTDRKTFIFSLNKKRCKQVFRCAMKVVVQVTLWTFVIFILCTPTVLTRSRRQSMGYGRTWLERNRCHYIIWSFCSSYQWIGSVFASKVSLPKSQSYLAHGAGNLLLEEVQPVLSWSSHVLNLCTVLPITDQ